MPGVARVVHPRVRARGGEAPPRCRPRHRPDRKRSRPDRDRPGGASPASLHQRERILRGRPHDRRACRTIASRSRGQLAPVWSAALWREPGSTSRGGAGEVRLDPFGMQRVPVALRRRVRRMASIGKMNPIGYELACQMHTRRASASARSRGVPDDQGLLPSTRALLPCRPLDCSRPRRRIQ